jgi:SAM-dependent methyltransferase
MQEHVKHAARRAQLGIDFFIQGRGIDVGCGPTRVREDAVPWDLSIDPSMDAHQLAFDDEAFDYVHSSHCIEHLGDPVRALREWWRVLKTDGYLVVVAPDFGLYEQRQWPSRYNADHKTQWSLLKLANLMGALPGAEILRASRNDALFDYSLRPYDRTLGEALADVEVVATKRSPALQSLFGSSCA